MSLMIEHLVEVVEVLMVLIQDLSLVELVVLLQVVMDIIVHHKTIQVDQVVVFLVVLVVKEMVRTLEEVVVQPSVEVEVEQDIIVIQMEGVLVEVD